MTSSGPSSIIESLTAGFAAVHRHPWLIGLPVVFDIGLWHGPRISVSPIVERAVDWYATFLQRTPDLSGATGDGVNQALAQAQDLGAALSQGNLFNLIAWQLPSLVWGVSPSLGEAAPSRWQIDSAPMAFMVALVLLVAGLLATATYLGIIALVVKQSEIFRGTISHIISAGWRRLVGFYGLVLLSGIPVGFVVLMTLGLASLAGPAMLEILATVAASLVMLAVLYLAFTREAMFIDDIGPLAAIRRSVRLVARFFWSAIGFLLLSNVITAGLTIVWSRLFIAHPLAGMLAIFGHAYIATGLTAAAMVFYRTRAAVPAGQERMGGIPA